MSSQVNQPADSTKLIELIVTNQISSAKNRHSWKYHHEPLTYTFPIT